MEDMLSVMKNFLKKFNEEIQSPTSEDNIQIRIGNYPLDPEDIYGQVIDWILNYFDDSACPYPLAVTIAKEVAQRVCASAYKKYEAEGDKSIPPVDLHSEAISFIAPVCSTLLQQNNLKPLCESKYFTSAFAIKNKRRKMEDRHVIHPDLNLLLDLKDLPPHSYYAVFDGHVGIDAAAYASAQLHINIAKHPAFLTDTPKAIIEGYLSTDLKFLEKCNKENLKSGCTVVSALIRENSLYLSWLGDSVAVVVKNGMPTTVTNPHRPDRVDEKQRIESLGGLVTFHGTWRVNGVLAITRAIGDVDQKKFIIGEPEVIELNLDGTEDFLILGCDGLWDEMSPEDATAVLYRYISDNASSEPPETIAAKLVHQSKLQGSEDNITAVVVFLRDIASIRETATKFTSVPSFVSNENHMSLNGSVKEMSDSELNSSYIKPTVLELNSPSSKKLKNAANVMSSTGLGDASFNYQHMDNPEGSFHSMNLDSSSPQSAFISHHSIAASCFAPEATALSELPTPPIDDMLASQQYDNFYSTDLYKKFETSQHLQFNTSLSDPPNLNDLPESQVDSLTPPIDSVVQGIESMNLQNDSSNINEEILPDEAVSIASDVVTTTIETAVRSLSDSPETVSVHSPVKLNPYAKPFEPSNPFFIPENASPNLESTLIAPTFETVADSNITKMENVSSDAVMQSTDSVISHEQRIIDPSNSTHENDFISKSMNLEAQIDYLTSATDSIDQNIKSMSLEYDCSTNLEEKSTYLLHEVEIREDNPYDKENVEKDSLLNDSSERIEAADVQNVLDPLYVSHTSDQSETCVHDVKNVAVESAVVNEVLSSSLSEIDPNSLLPLADFDPSQILDKSLPIAELNVLDSFISQTSNISENLIAVNKNTSPSSNEMQNLPDVGSEKTAENLIDDDVLNSETVSLITLANKDTNIEKNNEPLFSESNSQLPKDEISNASSAQIINKDNSCMGTVSENITEANLPENLIDIGSEKTTENPIDDTVLNSETISLITLENKNTNVEKNNESLFTEFNSQLPNDEISNASSAQIINTDNSCMDAVSENIIETNIELEKSPKVAENFDAKATGSISSMPVVENVVKESISLQNVEGNIPNPSEVEVSADPSVEDSHVEPVAVDLKSVPEGFPEAEGVTEDIDSDSEKDGGWSYMKASTSSGTKTKSSSKIAKETISSKPSSASKIKKDLAKTIESKAKPSKPIADKIKPISTLKAKTSTIDKTKTPPIEKSKNTMTVSRKPFVEKKIEDKQKSATLKPIVSSTVTKTVDKTSKVSTTRVRKEISETSTKPASTLNKPTSTLTKPLRPTTTSRVATSTARSGVATSNLASSTTRPKTTLSQESKPAVKTSTLPKTQPSVQSKPSSATRAGPSRPTTSVPSKTLTKPTGQKSASADLKSKPPVSTILRKPLSTTVKKTDVKEVKDNVNKQIIAKKATTTATSSLNNRKTAVDNNRNTSEKLSKRDETKNQTSKLLPSKPTSTMRLKASQITGKASEKKTLQNRTNMKKDLNTDNSDLKSDVVKNIENEQKVQAAQVSEEEKFILEANDKEIVEKSEAVSVPACDVQKPLENINSLADSDTPSDEKVLTQESL